MFLEIIAWQVVKTDFYYQQQNVVQELLVFDDPRFLQMLWGFLRKVAIEL